MFDSKSDYALNKKDPEAIVYPSATGVHIRLTCEEFASEEEFLYWKDLSDNDYHETEMAEHIYANHSLSLNILSEKATATPSAEVLLLSHQEQEEREKLRCLLLQGLDTQLSPKQRRRLWLYCVKGKSVRQIAEVDHVKHQSVVESLLAAKKKMREFLK